MLYLLVIGCGIWVYFDAKAIGARKGLLPGFFNIGPIGWALGTLLLWIIAFPLYLIKRGDIKAKASGKAEEHLHQNHNKSETTVTRSPTPPAIPDGNTKKCPYCAETIQKEAKFCRFCKQNINENKPNVVKEKPRTLPSDPLTVSKKQLQDKEYKEAVITLTNLIKKETSNKTAYYFRAIAYSKIKDKKNMLLDLEKSAKLGHKKAQETLVKLRQNVRKE